MKNIEKTLHESLGFSDKKTRVYLALLELGETEAGPIAKKTGLKRTTIYNILPELVSEGFISMTLRKGKKVFTIDSPSRLNETLDEKQLALKNILPDLKSMQAMFFHRPQITIHDGVSGFREIYRDAINTLPRGGTLLAYAGTREGFKYAPEDVVRDYVKRRLAKNIKLKIVSGTSPLSKELSDTASTSLREVKMTDDKSFDFAGETLIYGNKVAFISYGENLFGVIIESKDISAMQRAAFNMLWERL